MRALLLLLLLSSSLHAERWSTEALAQGLGSDFTRGEDVVDASDGGNGAGYSSLTRGSFAMEGKPGQIWRVSHTFFYESREALIADLKATITVLSNATGLERKAVLEALWEAMVRAKRSPKKTAISDLGGRKLDVSWAHVMKKKEMLMIFLQAKP